MERKTKIHAEEGKQDLVITREFDLPVELLFKANAEAEIIEQWMGTKVLKLESKKQGSWQFETKDEKGNVVFSANGVILSLFPTGKSPGHLKWTIRPLVFSSKWPNLNGLPMKPADLVSTPYMSLLLKGTRY
jgi:hypothetical protein